MANLSHGNEVAMGITEWQLDQVYPPSPARPGAPHIEVALTPEDWNRGLREDARVGLGSTPKELSPKWLYDERGSDLFEQITQLPEYYPTRRERQILETRADELAILSRADTLVELGSGSSAKTRLLLDALRRRGTLDRFVPFDVSEATLRSAARQLSRDYPELALHGVVGDFERHLDRIPPVGRRLFAFLGGTLGNLKPEARAAFYHRLHAVMSPGDTLLLGTDLLKDERRLFAAYNDAAGVTARFNLNVLSVLNRELGARFEAAKFHHLARFDPTDRWIEMLLISREAQTIAVPALGLTVAFEEGEALRTEVSTKFTPEQVTGELSSAHFAMVGFWIDDRGDFALSLWRR